MHGHSAARTHSSIMSFTALVRPCTGIGPHDRTCRISFSTGAVPLFGDHGAAQAHKPGATLQKAGAIPWEEELRVCGFFPLWGTTAQESKPRNFLTSLRLCGEYRRYGAHNVVPAQMKSAHHMASMVCVCSCGHHLAQTHEKTEFPPSTWLRLRSEAAPECPAPSRGTPAPPSADHNGGAP